jgi:hypothetical protein
MNAAMMNDIAASGLFIISADNAGEHKAMLASAVWKPLSLLGC